MTATADSSFSLNYQLLTNSYNAFLEGGKGLWKAQGELATSLDKESAKRYGVSQDEKRLNNCVTTPTYTTELKITDLGSMMVNKPANRDEMIKRLGKPVCQSVTGKDTWLVEGDQSLDASYAPTTIQLRGKDAK